MRPPLHSIAAHAVGVADRLTDLPPPLANPSALRARAYAPADLSPGAPMVVVLHGCTQTAAGYDHGAGWSTLADRYGFVLLFPEQARANNPNLCFNWFRPGDVSRTGGEAESIANIVKAMLAKYELDRSRVFITGLSAGGAMTAVMLATHPEMFAGGAIIGGLPYGCASNIPEALRQMREPQSGDGAALATDVRRAAGDYQGSWPTVSLWHGSADATVDISNMERLGRQWRHVHGIEDAIPTITREAGWEHRAWRHADGRGLVEEWRIVGMGHGVPLDLSGPEHLGAGGPYMLDVGISSTAHIARSWGLTAGNAAAVEERAAAAPASRFTRLAGMDGSPVPDAASSASAPAGAVQRTIERALRSAGLMR